MYSYRINHYNKGPFLMNHFFRLRNTYDSIIKQCQLPCIKILREHYKSEITYCQGYQFSVFNILHKNFILLLYLFKKKKRENKQTFNKILIFFKKKIKEINKKTIKLANNYNLSF